VRTAPAPKRTLALLALGWIAVLLVSLSVGGYPIGWSDLASGDPTAMAVFWRLRLPRVLLALIAGGGLAASGAAFQTLFRNPLAEPYTLGLASGAALGAVLAVQAGLGTSGSLSTLFLGSLLGALAVSLLVIGLAATRRGIDTGTLLLSGIAVSLSCSALILFVQYLADFTKTFLMVRWMMGGLAVVGYREVAWAAPWVALGVAVLLHRRWDLDLLLSGEELAASRGVDLSRLRWEVLGAVSAMVGALVAVTGPIGFVGLIVPHIVRRWTGHGHLVLLPACLLGGGVFLALCDLAARRVMAPAELPVGVLTALLGGQFFLWLLIRRRRRNGE
jgi:cobalamin transport system permease protein